MATADAPSSPPDALVTALEAALGSRSRTEPDDAARLTSLLLARERFAAMVGRRPAGSLAALPPPFEDVTLPSSVETALADFRDGIADEGGDPSAIGDRYEGTLGADTRGDRGQFFTPAPAAAALVRWALAGPTEGDDPPRLLDPAVGTGTFLLEAYRALRDDSGRSGREPPLGRLIGVDVDPVALQLAGLRLGAADGTSAPDTRSLHHASFFDCAPAGAGDSADAAIELPHVDAVVGNPPFIRADALAPDADHFRRHLGAFGPPGERPLLDGPEALSRRSDAYVYFVTHVTRFLREGGRLAMVLPTKWLMSEYGEGLRRFLRERYRIHAVVGVHGRAFDALVDTVLLFAERDGSAPPTAPIRFARVDRPGEASGILDDGAEADTPDRSTRPVDREQAVLTDAGSLARYLETPADLLALLESPAFARLDALADVARGTMTGANRFFFVDGGDVDRFGIDPRFLRPAVKSLRGVDRPAVSPADIDRWLLDVNPFVTSIRAAHGEADSVAVKEALASEGYDGLLAYVDHAEAAGWHTGRTCQSRAVWFDLGPLRGPAAFVPKLLRERVFAIRNAAGAIPSNAIDGIWPADGVDPVALLAVVNASVGKAAMEVTGRDESGLLQLMTYETASLPTLDVRRLSSAATRTLRDAGAAYAEAPTDETLATLDAVVQQLFDLPLSAASIRERATALRNRRVGIDPMVSDRSD